MAAAVEHVRALQRAFDERAAADPDQDGRTIDRLIRAAQQGPPVTTYVDALFALGHRDSLFGEGAVYVRTHTDAELHYVVSDAAADCVRLLMLASVEDEDGLADPLVVRDETGDETEWVSYKVSLYNGSVVVTMGTQRPPTALEIEYPADISDEQAAEFWAAEEEAAAADAAAFAAADDDDDYDQGYLQGHGAADQPIELDSE